MTMGERKALVFAGVVVNVLALILSTVLILRAMFVSHADVREVAWIAPAVALAILNMLLLLILL